MPCIARYRRPRDFYLLPHLITRARQACLRTFAIRLKILDPGVNVIGVFLDVLRRDIECGEWIDFSGWQGGAGTYAQNTD